jgi:hypothetical protein
LNPSLKNLLIRATFVAILPLLFLQYVFCLAYEEPYPAIIMPSFAGAPATEGEFRTVERRFRVLFQDKTYREFGQNAFLAQAPTSHRAKILDYNFSSRRRARPGYEGQLTDWVRKRCEVLTKRQDLDSLIIERLRVTRRDASQPGTEEALDRLVIAF